MTRARRRGEGSDDIIAALYLHSVLNNFKFVILRLVHTPAQSAMLKISISCINKGHWLIEISVCRPESAITISIIVTITIAWQMV